MLRLFRKGFLFFVHGVEAGFPCFREQDDVVDGFEEIPGVEPIGRDREVQPHHAGGVVIAERAALRVREEEVRGQQQTADFAVAPAAESADFNLYDEGVRRFDPLDQQVPPSERKGGGPGCGQGDVHACFFAQCLNVRRRVHGFS